MRFNNQEIQTIIKNSRKDQPINNIEDLRQIVSAIATYFIDKLPSDAPIRTHKLNFLDNDSFTLNDQLSMFVKAAFSDILDDQIDYGHELEQYLCVLKDRTGNEKNVKAIKDQIVAFFTEYDRGITVADNDRKLVNDIINQVRPIRTGEDLEEVMKSLTQEYVNRTRYFASQTNKTIVDKSREFFNWGRTSAAERVKNCVSHICIKTGEDNPIEPTGDLYRFLQSVRDKIADDSEVGVLKEHFNEALGSEPANSQTSSAVSAAAYSVVNELAAQQTDVTRGKDAREVKPGAK